MSLNNNYLQLKITGIEHATKNVKLFYLKLLNNELIKYKAGQYFTFIISDDKQEIRRSYSLASSPVLNEPLYIGVKRIDNGFFSRKLFDETNIGDVLITSGAAGFFTLPEEIKGKLFFFAAGSGIIPIYALIKTALKTSSVQIILIYSNHNIEETVFYNELLQLQNEFQDRFKIEFLFSNAKDLSKAYLHPTLIEEIINNYEASDDALFYLCGPESYMRLCTYTLQRNNITPQQIKKEIFNTSAKVYKAQPPDTEVHKVELIFRNKSYNLHVQYPKTILKAAREKDIILPYSCDTGRCGNCAAKCLQGKIWMSNNEVLTDKELNEGMVLTCTGYPVSGDAIIKIS